MQAVRQGDMSGEAARGATRVALIGGTTCASVLVFMGRPGISVADGKLGFELP